MQRSTTAATNTSEIDSGSDEYLNWIESFGGAVVDALALCRGDELEIKFQKINQRMTLAIKFVALLKPQSAQ